MTSSGHGPECFACGRSLERPGLDNIQAEVACIQCKGRTRLLTTGVELSTLLRSNKPYPLEGSGLAVLLNPVTIDGHRAWADFAAGGFAVFRERKRSADWFDFVVQHCEPGHSVLSRIRERGEQPMPMSLTQQLATCGKPWIEDLDRLVACWQLTRRGADAARAVGPIRTNSDAWAAADALIDLEKSFSTAEWATEWPELLQRLRSLASAA